MKFTIITPTLLRPTMYRTMASLRTQSFQEFEWLVGIDLPRAWWGRGEEALAAALIRNLKVHITLSDHPHENDYGHGMRRLLSARAAGEYVLYLDDDDFLSDANVLATLAERVQEKWAVFPVTREGSLLYNPDAIAPCNITLSSFVVHRDHCVFPEAGDRKGKDLYQLDWELVRGIIHDCGPPQRLDGRPLVTIPRPNKGTRDIEVEAFA